MKKIEGVFHNAAASDEPKSWITDTALGAEARSTLMSSLRDILPALRGWSPYARRERLAQIQSLSSRITSTPLLDDVEEFCREFVRASHYGGPLPIPKDEFDFTRTAITNSIPRIGDAEGEQFAKLALKSATDFCGRHFKFGYTDSFGKTRTIASNLVAKHAAIDYKHMVIAPCEQFLLQVG